MYVCGPSYKCAAAGAVGKVVCVRSVCWSAESWAISDERRLMSTAAFGINPVYGVMVGVGLQEDRAVG